MAQFIPSDTSTLSGKVLHVMTLMASVIYYVLALYRASINTIYVCTTVTSVILIILVELTLSCFYWVNFIIQLIGARSLLLHWLSPFTVIDVLTLPHSLVSLINGYDWLGFRSLRFLCLIKFDKLIEFLPCVNSSDAAKLVRIMLYFTGLWLAVSGLVQLLESSGDPWDSSVPPRQLTYWSSAYFVIVTLSTVGYGDITMTTVSGKILVTLFIVVNLVMCALVLPSLLNIIICYYQALQYKQIYKIHQSKRYLIVCGHITAQTTDSFLKELFHPDKQDNATYVTFLDPSAPTNELQQTLKRYFTRVQYYIGTPLSTIDLNKCGIHEASSVIVLADRHCLDPFEEDCTNLMRVVSVKTTCNAIPVILQLLSHQSKHMIGSIPKWNLAQSCLIPGFCTLISNLFFTTNLKQIKSNVLARSSWRRLYSLGACKEIYSVKFSAFFHGLTIFETAVVCYEELQLTFMADRIQDVLKAQRYCRACHKTNKSLQQCSCVSEREEPDALSSVVPQHRLHSTPLGAVTISLTCSMTPESLHLTLDTDPPPHPPSSLSNHIVLCVFATTNSITIGLSSFLTSLRSSSDIPVAVVTNADFFKKEWSTILNRTNIYCIYGNPLDWNCLKEAEITACQTCIVLSASSMSKEDW
jgi:potassium large conductance calcium-activated channel subfamily M alpha protein 1